MEYSNLEKALNLDMPIDLIVIGTKEAVDKTNKEGLLDERMKIYFKDLIKVLEFVQELNKK